MSRTDTALARAEEAMLDIPRARDFLARVAAEKDIWAARDFEDKVAAIAAYQASAGATLEAQNDLARCADSRETFEALCKEYAPRIFRCPTSTIDTFWLVETRARDQQA